MTGWTSAGPPMLASFLASLVECVEALTIVLAVGVVRGWRSTLLGAGAGVALLAVLVVALGTSLAAVPLPIFQLLVGVLLLMFGVRWLRKAVLRQAGVLSLHDETEAFVKEAERMRRQSLGNATALDKVAFVTTFKTMMLEGIEVVFIVIAMGAGGRMLGPAAVGAALAMAVVLMLGLWLHRPLSKVPENALKFSVGVMLAGFGTFWAGEGIGLHWPGEDLAVAYLIASFLVLALALVRVGRNIGRSATGQDRQPSASVPARRPLVALATELLGLFVDDGWLAGGVLAWTSGAWVFRSRHPTVSAGACAAFASGILLLLALSVARASRLNSGRAETGDVRERK